MRQLQDLLDREVTRQEFLAILGLAALSLLGVSSFFKAIDRGLDGGSDNNNNYNRGMYNR